MPKVPKRKESEVAKVKLNLDVSMCDVLILYALSKYPSNIHLANLKKLLNVIDLESYNYNYDIYNRLLVVSHILDARLNEELSNMTLIRNEVEKDPLVKDITKDINWSDDALTIPDVQKVSKYVESKMQYYLFECAMPNIIKKWESCQKTGFNTSNEVVEEIKSDMTSVVANMQASNIGTQILRRFSFADPQLDKLIYAVVDQQKQPTSILRTGMRQMNAMLDPGFRSGKLYTFLGPSGKFKSGTLLNIADQIRTFNPQAESLTPDGRRNTILFVTMENDIPLTVERIFSMYAPNDKSFLDSTYEEVLDVIKNKGNFRYSDTKGIDIDIRFFKNLEINTNDLYNIIEDMHKNGANCICLILDYLKRIESATNCHGDEVVRAANASNELKNLAEHYHIPVITAQQINRNGNSVLDAASRAGKADLINFVGNSDIGGAWAVVENSDWICLLNLERKASTGELFVSFKRTKQRAGSNGGKNDSLCTYFNHPFVPDSALRLQTDVDKDRCASVVTLKSDIEAVDLNELDTGAGIRPIVMRANTTAHDALETLGFVS